MGPSFFFHLLETYGLLGFHLRTTQAKATAKRIPASKKNKWANVRICVPKGANNIDAQFIKAKVCVDICLVMWLRIVGLTPESS